MVVVDIAEVESGREDHSTRCAGDGTSHGRVREVNDLRGYEPQEGRRCLSIQPKEVDDSEEKQLGSRSKREEERLKEVAGVGDYTDFGPARRDRYSAET
jgi:hypothetical protein